MSGGIRYLACCDGCGIDVNLDRDEYFTLAQATAARDWASRVGGWLWRKPNTDDQWLTCPECTAAGN
jgi:hypothetical protein